MWPSLHKRSDTPGLTDSRPPPPATTIRPLVGALRTPSSGVRYPLRSSPPRLIRARGIGTSLLCNTARGRDGRANDPNPAERETPFVPPPPPSFERLVYSSVRIYVCVHVNERVRRVRSSRENEGRDGARGGTISRKSLRTRAPRRSV